MADDIVSSNPEFAYAVLVMCKLAIHLAQNIFYIFSPFGITANSLIDTFILYL